MNYRLISLFLLSLCFACQEDSLETGNAEINPEVILANEANYCKGFIRVKLKEEVQGEIQLNAVRGKVQTGIAEIDRIAEQLGASKIERVFPYGGKFEPRMQKAGLHLWYDIEFDENIPVSRAVSDFSNIPGIETVEPVLQARRLGDEEEVIPVKNLEQIKALATEAPFNDPGLSLQWHYHNEGNLPNSVAGADINLYRAWKVTAGSREVIVAVVDGGIDYNHEDLRDNVWINEDEQAGNEDLDNNGYRGDVYGWNFVSDISTIIPHSHGTHVAGTIAAVNNNGKGVCGIAGGSGVLDGVRVMSCQIFEPSDDPGGKSKGNQKIPQAIVYGANNGAVISQNSWSYVFEQGSTPYLNASTKAAIDYFIEYAGLDENGNQVGPMKGGIVIFAAGNDDSDRDAYPAKYEKVLSVASMAPDFVKAYYSNYADWVDITAPGGSYRYGGKYNDACPVYSTIPGNAYGYKQGTSMACPHVSGVAALVVSTFGVGHPGFTPEDLKAILLENVGNIDQYNPAYRGKLGVGYLDAGAALSKDEGIAPEPVTDLQVEWKYSSAFLTWSVTRDEDNGKAAYYHIYWSTQSLEGIDFTHLPAGVTKETVSVNGKQPGDKMTVEITGLIAGKVYYIALIGEDRFGNKSTATISKGQTLFNEAPVINRRTTGDIVLKAVETVEIVFDVTDPEGHAYTYEIQDPAQIATVTKRNETLVVTLAAKKARAGNYTAVLTVTDEGGASAKVEIPYTILPNQLPVITAKVLENLYFDKIGDSKTLNLSEYFEDPDGETLRYAVKNSSPSLIRAVIQGEQLVVNALKSGKVTLELTAYDYFGESVSRSFFVMARDGSQEVDLYPNPVVNQLNIRMGQEVDGNVEVKVYNTSGGLVIEQLVAVHPFEPGVLNMSQLSGGSYLIILKYEGREIKRSIVKL